MKNVSKKIKKCIRGKKFKKARTDSANIGEFKGIKHISNIKSAKKRILTPKIKNEKSEVITSRRGIANGFGEFYSKLYVDDECDNEEQDADKRKMRTGIRNKVDGEGEVKKKTRVLPLTAPQKRKSRRHQNMRR